MTLVTVNKPVLVSRFLAIEKGPLRNVEFGLVTVMLDETGM